MAKKLADHLNPRLEFIGVLEMMSPKANEGQDVRADGRRTIIEALRRSCPGVGIMNESIPRRTSIADAHLAALNGTAEIREIFQKVGREIQHRVGL